MKKYRIVRQYSEYNSIDINDFEKTVTKYLNEGWECVGGVSLYENNGDRCDVIMQAMIHEENE
jgi:hypothetical protein